MIVQIKDLKEDDFLFYGDHAYQLEDFMDAIEHEILENGTKELDKFFYIAALEKDFVKIDIKEIVIEACEDGYENMCEGFNFDSDTFKEVESALNKWLKEHENVNTVYWKGKKKISLQNILQEIENQKTGDLDGKI